MSKMKPWSVILHLFHFPCGLWNPSCLVLTCSSFLTLSLTPLTSFFAIGWYGSFRFDPQLSSSKQGQPLVSSGWMHVWTYLGTAPPNPMPTTEKLLQYWLHRSKTSEKTFLSPVSQPEMESLPAFSPVLCTSQPAITKPCQFYFLNYTSSPFPRLLPHSQSLTPGLMTTAWPTKGHEHTRPGKKSTKVWKKTWTSIHDYLLIFIYVKFA